MTTETNMNKKHQNAYKNKRTNRMLARKVLPTANQTSVQF